MAQLICRPTRDHKTTKGASDGARLGRSGARRRSWFSFVAPLPSSETTPSRLGKFRNGRRRPRPGRETLGGPASRTSRKTAAWAAAQTSSRNPFSLLRSSAQLTSALSGADQGGPVATATALDRYHRSPLRNPSTHNAREHFGIHSPAGRPRGATVPAG